MIIKNNNSGILLSVTQSFSGFPGGSRDHPFFMICSRTRSLCTFTALVEIRCCGPSSCDIEREKEKQTGKNKVSGIRKAAANMLRVAGSWLSHRLTGTANSVRNRREEEEKRNKVCQSQPEISGLKVGWEICVKTIWNRHLHCDSTNPRKA